MLVAVKYSTRVRAPSTLLSDDGGMVFVKSRCLKC